MIYNIETLGLSGKNLVRYEAIALSMNIAFVIGDFIKSRGISIQDIAKAAGVSNHTMRKVFSGDKLVTLPMLAGITQKYKVTFSLTIKELEK